VPNWVKACAVDDVEQEDVIPFELGGKDYAIYRSEDDEFFASDGHCTHEKTLLCDGLVMDGVIECPKHNGRFDFRTGRALSAPAIVDLEMYAVKVEGGDVHIDVDVDG
jgi:3-phenylpropionate/trans-cinnamate dioxygenase ferredoxin subunit